MESGPEISLSRHGLCVCVGWCVDGKRGRFIGGLRRGRSRNAANQECVDHSRRVDDLVNVSVRADYGDRSFNRFNAQVRIVCHDFLLNAGA
jgi:hypothetical protein